MTFPEIRRHAVLGEASGVHVPVVSKGGSPGMFRGGKAFGPQPVAARGKVC